VDLIKMHINDICKKESIMNFIRMYYGFSIWYNEVEEKYCISQSSGPFEDRYDTEEDAKKQIKEWLERK